MYKRCPSMEGQEALRVPGKQRALSGDNRNAVADYCRVFFRCSGVIEP